MKHILFIISITTGAFLLNGCYTQVVVRDDGARRYDYPDYSETYENAESGTVINNYYGYDTDWRWRSYFSFYYPFRSSFLWSSYYDPYWNWCGTSYAGYNPWWDPFYYGHPYRWHGYYTPAYYPGYYRYHYPYYTYTPTTTRVRTFGSTRTDDTRSRTSGFTRSGGNDESLRSTGSSGVYERLSTRSRENKDANVTPNTTNARSRTSSTEQPTGTTTTATPSGTRVRTQDTQTRSGATDDSRTRTNTAPAKESKAQPSAPRQRSTYSPPPSSPPPSAPAPSSRGSDSGGGRSRDSGGSSDRGGSSRSR